jgi:D-alanine-D-alanine ligase
MSIAIVCGGNSFEHEISIVSAISLKSVLKERLIYIFLDDSGEFYHIPTDKMKSNLFSSGEYKKMKKIYPKKGGFFESSIFGDKKIDFEIVINLVHGADGEDGKLSSIFELYGIKHIGPRGEASTISYNKFLTKAYAKSLGVNVLDFELLNINSKDKKSVIKFPIIVKPLRLGSSIGVSIVNRAEDLDYALDTAFEFDDDVLLEPFIDGVKEYNLAGFKAQDFVFSIVEEPQKGKFLDFDKKYLDFSRTATVNKADIKQSLQNQLEDTFKTIYNTMFNGSLIRCDFFVIDDEVFLNEINPIPGSMANYLFSDFNSSIKDLAFFAPIAKSSNVTYEYINKIQSAKGK